MQGHDREKFVHDFIFGPTSLFDLARQTVNRQAQANPQFGDRLRRIFAPFVPAPSSPIVVHATYAMVEELATDIDADADALREGAGEHAAVAAGFERKLRGLRQRIEGRLRQALMLVRIPGSSRKTEVVAFGDVLAALAEILGDQPAASPWRDISSAPQDETAILVDFGRDGVHRVFWLEDAGWCVSDGKSEPRTLRGWSRVYGWMPVPSGQVELEGVQR
jgi:hypothetical protein